MRVDTLHTAFIAILLIAAPAKAEMVKNTTYGFSISMPMSWRKTNRDVVISKNGYALFYAKPFDSGQNGIAIRASPAPQLDDIPLTSCLHLLLAKISKLQPFRSYSKPADTSVAGVKAAYARFEFDTRDMYGPFTVTRDVWVFRRAGLYWQIEVQDKNTDSLSLAAGRKAVESLTFR